MGPSFDPIQQHTISAAAIVVPVTSMWIHAAPVITDVVGALGITWYTVLFVEKCLHWYKRWKSKHK